MIVAHYLTPSQGADILLGYELKDEPTFIKRILCFVAAILNFNTHAVC